MTLYYHVYVCDSDVPIQFSYSGSDGVPVHIVQLTFLKLLSATAKQTFTYHCLNSAAWLHAATYSHEQALRFRGSNGEELTHENTHYISALYDGCQVSNTDIHLSVNIHTFVRFLIVFLCCRRAQGRRGRCWSLTLRCPTRSPSLMWLCPILERGTRNLVSKLARSATTVNQAGVICRKKSHGHFLHAGRKLHSRLTWCHIFISRFTYSSVPSSKHWFFHTHIFTQTVSVTRTFISRHWHTYTVFSRAVHKCIDCQPCPQLHTFISFIPLWRSDWCCHSRIHVWLYIYWSMHFTSSHTSESSSEIHHISVTFTYHIVLYYHQTSICCIVVNFLFVDVILLL